VGISALFKEMNIFEYEWVLVHCAMNERVLRMGEWNSRRQWNMKIGRSRQTF